MLSAVIPSVHSYPAMLLAKQPEHQRYVHSGPLVLGADPLRHPTPTADRDRTVSRRSKPSSRTTLNGEQPYPWDLHTLDLPPGCDEPTIEVPNTAVDMDSWAVSACYPRRTFYPLSDGPSIQNHRITNTYFRTCSTCLSRSQAPFCVCTHCTISDRAEGTLALLRYSTLGGDRPSQTTHQTLSLIRITDLS